MFVYEEDLLNLFAVKYVMSKLSPALYLFMMYRNMCNI